MRINSCLGFIVISFLSNWIAFAYGPGRLNLSNIFMQIVTKIGLMTRALNSAVPKELAGADLNGETSKLLALISLTAVVRATRSDPSDDSMVDAWSGEIALRK